MSQLSTLTVFFAAVLTFSIGAYARSGGLPDHATDKRVDARQLVRFPPAMRAHMLANMRDHLRTLAQIQAHLAVGRYRGASELAEQRLGMTSLKAHDARALSHYMPARMRALGMALHRHASEFALAAQTVEATGEPAPALAALARTMETCVACHATYRVH